MFVNHIMYKCIQCMQCVDSCPEGSLYHYDFVFTYSPEDCLFCGKCRDVCVNGAIELMENFKI